MLQKLRTVICHVADLPAAKAWYILATGKQPYFDEPFYVGFDINGCELGLDPDMSGVQAGNHSVSYWAVASARIAVEHFLSIGAQLVQDVTNVGGPIQVAILADSFGNQIGVIEGA